MLVAGDWLLLISLSSTIFLSGFVFSQFLKKAKSAPLVHSWEGFTLHVIISKYIYIYLSSAFSIINQLEFNLLSGMKLSIFL